MLHILNGDSTAAVFAASGLDGDTLVWRDILMEGPPPVDPAARAAALAAYLGIDPDDYRRAWAEQLRGLDGTQEHDDVALWFEQDLFCSVNLWFLLAWFSHHPGPRLSLVYPGPIQGVGGFKGLGALPPADLPPLLEQRVRVRDGAQALGRAAWDAYADSDPTSLERVAGGDASALPAVREMVRGHLGRFPSLADGLSEVERAILRAVAERPRDFAEVFGAIGVAPAARSQGLGDIQVAAYARQMSAGADPLLTLGAGGNFRDWRIALTARGGQVLDGSVRWRGHDRWLGGVRVDPRSPWRWDRRAARLARA